MVTDKLKELAALKAKTAELERAVAAERNAALSSLPSQYGFADAEEFAAAVLAATGARRGRPPGKIRPGRPAGNAPAIPRRRHRRRGARISDETRAEVKRLVADGKTGAEIARTLSISLPSVQNIKKALGLVKKRK